MNQQTIILASASPRRRAFLAQLGLDHTTASADIDETPLAGEGAQELAIRLASSKAAVVAQQLANDQKPAIVIGADTVVALGSILLGKPADTSEATAMLTLLRGKVHQVHTALAFVPMQHPNDTLHPPRQAVTLINTTDVTMRSYTDAEIAVYLATGDHVDKAGAYAMQHRGFDPASHLDGCPSGVMGLPVADLLAQLAQFGISTQCAFTEVCQQHTGLRCCQIDSPPGG